MKLVTYRKGRARPRAGVLVDGDRVIVDLSDAYRLRHGKRSRHLDSVLAIIEGGDEALDIVRALAEDRGLAAGVCIDRVSATLLAPVPRPPQMRDFLCFEKHLIQGFRALRSIRARSTPDPAAALAAMEAAGTLAVPSIWYERPVFYHPSRFAVCGPETDVVWPPYSETMDFELEFGCYIGRPCKDVTRDDARAHIFGYTIFNDFSARDEQTLEMAGQLGPGKGKDFDNANAMGPWLVTADEVGDPYTLEMIARVNGEEWGRGNTRDMHWTFEDCIAHVSRSETIHAGEFFGSGTVGDGCGLEHLRFLASGDVVELEVERIGVLRNRVVQGHG